MITYPTRPAAFINALYEEGTKSEAIQFLQETWNELCYVKDQLRDAEERISNLNHQLDNNRQMIDGLEYELDRVREW